MDFDNPSKLRFFTNCVLFWVLKRLDEEGGGGGVVVIDFVTNATKPKYLLQKSDRYMSLKLCILVCVCVCVGGGVLIKLNFKTA